MAGQFVVTQLPADGGLEIRSRTAVGMLPAAYGDGSRIVLVSPGRKPRILTGQFHSACDPVVSFDGTRLLFAAKPASSDGWNIFEMSVDGSDIRQITEGVGNCRSPCYQSTLYTLDSPKPWYQITFVSDAAGEVNECGLGPATSLYSCKLDGTAVRRLTFNLSSDIDPVIMLDGRLLYASWQRARLDHGRLGRVGLFGINLDGTDCALFAGYEGKLVKHMPCITTSDLAVFVEADRLPWDGAGSLGCVELRRPLHSYRRLTGESDGLFHSPSPLPDGRILVSRRPGDGTRTHGVWRFDPSSGKAEPLFDDPNLHDIQAKWIFSRPEPDGRSTVVTEDDPCGILYCLNVYTSDLNQADWMPAGSVKRLRVLEGEPRRASSGNDSSAAAFPPLARRRVLGEIPIEADGSFSVKIPANTPVELQILDSDGMALRSCGWIWAKNREPRGCIGCHEDGELTPENLFVDALAKPPAALLPPPEQRRTVDFRRDVAPIIAGKCAPCHSNDKMPLVLDGRLESAVELTGKLPLDQDYARLLAADESAQPASPWGRYVHAGRARTSPLVWHVFGRNTSRPWDGPLAASPVKPMPPGDAKPLSDTEKRTLVEWIDMGASLEMIPSPDGRSGGQRPSGRKTVQEGKR